MSVNGARNSGTDAEGLLWRWVMDWLFVLLAVAVIWFLFVR